MGVQHLSSNILLYVCVRAPARARACMYVCMYICMCVYVCAVCVCASAYRYVYVCMYVCMYVYVGIYVGLYIFRFKVPTFVTTYNTPAGSSKISVNVYHITRRHVLTGQYSALCSSRKAANSVDWEVKEVKEKERICIEY